MNQKLFFAKYCHDHSKSSHLPLKRCILLMKRKDWRRGMSQHWNATARSSSSSTGSVWENHGVSSVVANEKYQLNFLVFKINWIWHEGTPDKVEQHFRKIPTVKCSCLRTIPSLHLKAESYPAPRNQLQQFLFLRWSFAFPGSRKKWFRIQIWSVPPSSRWREVCFLSQITSVILLTALSNRNCYAGTAEGEPTTTQG